MLKEHLLQHANAFIVVQCLTFLIFSAIYGWKTAYKTYNIKKINTTTMQKIRNSAKYMSKMIFIFALSAGISWTIDYLT
jgi:TRAP-type C4-dicarboxylate transport system permease small subunit